MQHPVAAHQIDGIQVAAIVGAVGLEAIFQVGQCLSECRSSNRQNQYE
jgi:hypothetical protein